ncbi:transposase [Streptomyces bugieae]|uniref:transposase n=1 Tax=Streptomyces bugieae TaxID=3098223 RepID=UPI003AFF63C4
MLRAPALIRNTRVARSWPPRTSPRSERSPRDQQNCRTRATSPDRSITFQTGTQWVHLPERYGNWRGVYNRLRMWALDDTWERVFTALVAQADADEDLTWAASAEEPADHAIGRSRGGLRTKIQLAADADGRLLPSFSLPGKPVTHPPSPR